MNDYMRCETKFDIDSVIWECPNCYSSHTETSSFGEGFFVCHCGYEMPEHKAKKITNKV